MEETLQTYRGVFLDINKSNICSLQHGMYFYFCSEGMKDKFERNLENYIKVKEERLKKILPNTRFVDMEIVLALEYYKYVEKRGFRVETFRGVKIRQSYLLADIEFTEPDTEE